MKRAILTAIICAAVTCSQAQVLLKSIQGEPILSPYTTGNVSSTLINLNTGNTSLGADYFVSTKADNASRYRIFRFGLSAKATDGLGPLVKQGQVTPGMNAVFGYTKVGIATPKNDTSRTFLDWFNFTASFNADKYKMFRSDTVFKAQISNQNFRGFAMNINYTMAFGLEKQDYVNVGLFGYARKNNVSDLTSVDVQDYQVTTNAATGVERHYGSTQTAKQGTYQEYDAYTFSLSYTRLPKYEPATLGKKPKVTKIKTVVTTNAGTETLIHHIRKSDGKDSLVTETIERKPRKDSVTTETTDMVAKDNPFFKSLKLGYAIYFNTNPTNRGTPAISNLGGTFFLVSPNKDNQVTPRLGLNFEFSDFFDSKHANNGPFARLAIGFTTTFSL